MTYIPMKSHSFFVNSNNLTISLQTQRCHKSDVVLESHQTRLISNLPVIMSALWNRAGHILPCGFYLSFLFFFSSPNLSHRRLDVYHTSTHDVALVQIYNACLKCTARGSLEIQDAKNCHLDTFAQLCSAISSQIRHVLTIRKKPVKQQYFLQMSPQYGELRPTNG